MAIKKIAEVISASSGEFTAQCYRLHHAPPLGALVKTRINDEMQVFGVVYNVETHSLEPGRRVMVRGNEMDSEEDIYHANPHLEKLLSTDFKAQVVGYKEKNKNFYYLPPVPSSIHGFIYLCDESEIMAFSQSLNFLTPLLESKLIIYPDDVVAACLRYLSKYQENMEVFLIHAGKELLWTLRGDVQRLSAILKRLEIGK